MGEQWDKVIEHFTFENNEASKMAIIFQEINIQDLDPDIGLQATSILVNKPRKINFLIFLIYLRESEKGCLLIMLINSMSFTFFRFI